MDTHFLWVFLKELMIFPLEQQQQQKSGEASNTGRSNSQQAKLKACNVITVYQPRLILIWFLNPCVIKTARKTASGERRRRGKKKDISQMLRPSVRVTRKVILGFKWTNPKLVRALTLQGKGKSSFHLSPSFKHANRLPRHPGALAETLKARALSANHRVHEKQEVFQICVQWGQQNCSL